MALLLLSHPGNPDMIIKTGKRLIVAIFCCLSCLIVCGLILSGCATTKTPGPTPWPPMKPDVIAMKILSAETSLERIAAGPSRKDEKADLLLYLVMLNTHPDNPSPDYQRSIKYLNQYLRLGRQTVNANFALSLLMNLSECVAARNSACGKLAKQNQELDKQCQELTRENLSLKQVIEKLKSLDIQLEKKRKSFD